LTYLNHLTLSRMMPHQSLTTLTLALTLSLLAACSKQEPAPEPVRSVKLVTVGEDAIHSAGIFPGEVRAQVESRLSFRVAGKLVRRSVELGQHVKAGQVLAQLDPQDYQLATQAAQAQVSAALTNRDLAAADFKRFKDLRDQNFISAAELERREATLKAAQAQVDQAQAQRASQGNQASYTTLLADVSGAVTAIEAEPGQVVAAGTPVVRIAQDGPRDAVFAVTEDQVSRIKPGSAVDVMPWGATSKLSGLVREVAASADPATRTFTVKVGLDKQATLPLGSTVNLRPHALERSATVAIKLPSSVLMQSGGQATVWVLDKTSMTVNQVPVQVQTADGNDAVITAGLKPGMQVVAAGVHVLSPGQKVSIYQSKASAPAAAVSVAK
jgi:membrane fusion protein, multidrug efflux system